MATNAWTHRRWRLPRPPVCKSYPRQLPATGGPPGTSATLVWNLNPDGHNSTFAGTVLLADMGGEQSWLVNSLDDQGIAFRVEVLTPTGGPALVFKFSEGLPGGTLWEFGVNLPPWPGTRPWQSATGMIQGTISPDVGEFFINFNP